MPLFTPANKDDSWPKALAKTLNPRFQIGFMRQTRDQFRSKNDHILAQNTAKGTIVLVPGLTCRPSTLRILQAALIKILWDEYNIVFSRPHDPILNNTAWRDFLWSHYRSEIARILDTHEKNGNGIILAHSHGGTATVSAILDEYGSPIPKDVHIDLLAPSLGKVWLANIPLWALAGALDDLRKERVFSDREIEEFLKNIDSVNVTITEKDSLVPPESQHITANTIGENYAHKVTEVTHPWDHLDAVNGAQVSTYAGEVADRIKKRR